MHDSMARMKQRGKIKDWEEEVGNGVDAEREMIKRKRGKRREGGSEDKRKAMDAES